MSSPSAIHGPARYTRDVLCIDAPNPTDTSHPERMILPPSLLRRRCEQFAAFVLLIAMGLPLILVAIAVRLTSKGTILYRQTRCGLGGKPFRIYKFRSMIQDAEVGTGAVWATKNDPRMTLIGRVLRKMHLDELPQLWNIFRGDMAFIGPRPERPEIIEALEREIPGYHDRLAVLPGVTGLAQVNLDPDESIQSVKRKFELDVEYIFSASLLVDLRIAAATLLKMLFVPKIIATAIFLVRREPIVTGQSGDNPRKQWRPPPEKVEHETEALDLEAVG